MKRIKKITTVSAAMLLASTANATEFFINRVGYDVGKPVSVIVKSETNLDNAEFKVLSSGSEVSTGTLSKGVNPDNWLSNGNFYVADLGTTLAAGSYTLQITENNQPQTSGEFKVEENALAKKTLGLVLDYFYDDRADNETIMGWEADLKVYKSEKRLNVQGGWYDASGDVSKYLSHLSYANYLNPQQIPLTVWSLAFAAERIPALLGQTSTKAKTANEAVYGADFLLRMLDEAGFFYMTVFDNWGNPYSSRELCAFSGEDGERSEAYQTAFREGGGMAIAALARASMLSVKGDSTSEQYLAGAKRAFEHLQGKQSIGGNCEYCDDHKENVIDDYTALLAASELYAASKDSAYLKAARERAAHLAGRVSTDGYFWSDDAKTRPFWHASDAGLPLVALVRYMELETEPEFSDSVRVAVETHYRWLLSITNKVDNPFGYARQTYKTQGNIKDGFFIPHDNESNYWWQGEDARIASLAAASVYAFRMLELDSAEGVEKYSADQLDWILGKNPYGVCMMKIEGMEKVPDVYDGQSDYDATLAGGIANGISGKNVDGSGIVWDNVAEAGFPADEPWNNWRWIEQWLPHSTWYLMALATRYDEVMTKAPVVRPDTTTQPGDDDDAVREIRTFAESFKADLAGRTLLMDFANVNAAKLRNAVVRVVGLDGHILVSTRVNGAQMSVELPSRLNGVFFVQVPGLGAKKIIVR
ncbi:MAG: glycoside hydrolase family 9 protein [Fibrobacter sp.]|nr:glycoside hydrolase family 9 protein [Fibrobacter sp.]